MDMKSSFMGGLCLKPTPKIVTKTDNKPQTNRHKSAYDPKQSHPKNSSLNSLNSMVNQNSVLSGNSLNQLSQSVKSGQSMFKNKTPFNKQAENLKQPIRSPPKSVSLLQKSPAKMQSLLQRRSILNTMNSNLIANHFNSNNLLINSLMKTTISSSNGLTFNQPEKSSSSSSFNDTSRMDEKMMKVIKLCVTRLEFSSPLFRRIATKMSFLYVGENSDQIRNYERFCSTSNKAVLKQVMNKAHTLKYKPSRGRSRMLRSNEIVDGKVMISWQRGAYVHVYTFNKRQRKRRYRQISMEYYGLEHRTLQIMYGLKKVTLPKIVDCPSCDQPVSPDGHCCVVTTKSGAAGKRLRSSNRSLLLKRTHQQVQLNDSVHTSDYLSNESDNSLDLVSFHQFNRNDRRSLLEDDSRISLHKFSRTTRDEQLLLKRCPTLLLDSSNYKTNQNSILNVIVRRMDSKELNKKVNSLQRNESSNSMLDKLQLRKVNALPVKNLIKCSVMNQHSNFAVSSMENSIKIVFK